MNGSPKSRNDLLLEAYRPDDLAGGRIRLTDLTPIGRRDDGEGEIAELKTTVDELAPVVRAETLGTLAASIAHELTQPLFGIVTNARTCQRMLAAAPPDIRGAVETLRRTVRDANRAAEVITRLRALFSRRNVAIAPLDLNVAAREMIERSLSELRTNEVVVRMELAENLPPVTGDRVQLEQVILNLLRNAAEAMSAIDDRPRELVIRTERSAGAQVRLSVKDVGVGLPALGAERLFEPFFTTKPDGMGIGLCVSRSIIESHRGRLWASRNDGPGSTFSFSIPCRAEAGASSDEGGSRSFRD